MTLYAWRAALTPRVASLATPLLPVVAPQVEEGGQPSAAERERSTCDPLKVQSVALLLRPVVAEEKGPAEALAVDATETSSTRETIS